MRLWGAEPGLEFLCSPFLPGALTDVDPDHLSSGKGLFNACWLVIERKFVISGAHTHTHAIDFEVFCCFCCVLPSLHSLLVFQSGTCSFILTHSQVTLTYLDFAVGNICFCMFHYVKMGLEAKLSHLLPSPSWPAQSTWHWPPLGSPREHHVHLCGSEHLHLLAQLELGNERRGFCHVSLDLQGMGTQIYCSKA